GNSLVAEFEFKDFAEAMQFVNRVAEMAESVDHHPDIDIRWNKVRLVLSTHSEGGITQKDLDLAGQIVLA
ncbi:MAG TPA: 4a-hydroxytetrahydrobiopterin dehydratase, partial [Acidimicrobiia bacterium]|nr:4a-hydroxytetrahydrobiopterin dehydratase [Acidimicrobiia bacterium]